MLARYFERMKSIVEVHGGTVEKFIGDAVEVEAVEPLVLKGKSVPVAAFRLLDAHGAAPRRQAARFVGREQELAAIEAAWRRALAEQRCELVTVVGEAGVGKSHLVAE